MHVLHACAACAACATAGAPACATACAACCMHVLHAACMCCCVRRGFTPLQIAGTIIIAIFNTPVMMGNTPCNQPYHRPTLLVEIVYSTWFYLSKSGKYREGIGVGKLTIQCCFCIGNSGSQQASMAATAITCYLYASRTAHAPSPITACMLAGRSRVNIVLPIVKRLLTPVRYYLMQHQSVHRLVVFGKW